MITNNRTISDDMFENANLHVPNGRWQSVFGLAVIPSKRHQGCASTLMRAFIEKARQEGTRRTDSYLQRKAHSLYEGLWLRQLRRFQVCARRSGVV